jgi:eukaryotic-like serine/threonine-protein kinase
VRDAAPVAEHPGTVIGPHKLLHQLGEGGMGTVFVAEQTQPVQRKVALKIRRRGAGQPLLFPLIRVQLC